LYIPVICTYICIYLIWYDMIYDMIWNMIYDIWYMVDDIWYDPTRFTMTNSKSAGMCNHVYAYT
jgi:hypothetical protein